LISKVCWKQYEGGGEGGRSAAGHLYLFLFNPAQGRKETTLYYLTKREAGLAIVLPTGKTVFHRSMKKKRGGPNIFILPTEEQLDLRSQREKEVSSSSSCRKRRAFQSPCRRKEKKKTRKAVIGSVDPIRHRLKGKE